MKPKMVKIDWVDAQSLDSAIIEVEDIKNLEPTKCSMIGWLVHENKNNYYIAKELWEDGSFKYLHIIPKKTAIIKITELKEVRK